MAYALDTNACRDYFTGRYPRVVARIQACSPDDLRLSVVVVAELRNGADHSTRRRANHARIDALVEEIATLDFDLRAAAAYGSGSGSRTGGSSPDAVSASMQEGRMRDTVTVSLPPGIRRELDRIAAREGVSRSDVLRASLEDYPGHRPGRPVRSQG
jgi:predicted nucleic acid-binding protein